MADNKGNPYSWYPQFGNSQRQSRRRLYKRVSTRRNCEEEEGEEGRTPTERKVQSRQTSNPERTLRCCPDGTARMETVVARRRHLGLKQRSNGNGRPSYTAKHLR